MKQAAIYTWTFATMSEAFDFCRARDKPCRVQVRGQRWKIFPSGRAEPLNYAAVQAGIADGYLKMEDEQIVLYLSATRKK